MNKEMIRLYLQNKLDVLHALSVEFYLINSPEAKSELDELMNEESFDDPFPELREKYQKNLTLINDSIIDDLTEHLFPSAEGNMFEILKNAMRYPLAITRKYEKLKQANSLLKQEEFIHESMLTRYEKVARAVKIPDPILSDLLDEKISYFFEKLRSFIHGQNISLLESLMAPVGVTLGNQVDDTDRERNAQDLMLRIKDPIGNIQWDFPTKRPINNRIFFMGYKESIKLKSRIEALIQTGMESSLITVDIKSISLILPDLSSYNITIFYNNQDLESRTLPDEFLNNINHIPGCMFVEDFKRGEKHSDKITIVDESVLKVITSEEELYNSTGLIFPVIPESMTESLFQELLKKFK